MQSIEKNAISNKSLSHFIMSYVKKLRQEATSTDRCDKKGIEGDAHRLSILGALIMSRRKTPARVQRMLVFFSDPDDVTTS